MTKDKYLETSSFLIKSASIARGDNVENKDFVKKELDSHAAPRPQPMIRLTREAVFIKSQMATTREGK